MLLLLLLVLSCRQPIDTAANRDEENIDDDNGDEQQQHPNNDNGHVPFVFTPGKRKNSVLIYATDEQQLYRKDRQYGGGFYYRCNVVGCKARMFYETSTTSCKRKRVEHTHGDRTLQMKEGKLREAIKDECLQMAGNLKRNKSSVDDIITSNVRK